MTLAVALAGCPRGDGKPTLPREPPARGVFRPSTVAAGTYNESTDPEPPEGELESLLLDVVTQKALEAGRTSPLPDPRLAAAARDLATTLTGDEPPAYDLIEFALQHHGIIEPSPHLVVVEMTPGGEDALVDELRAKLPAVLAEGKYRRFGAGFADTGTTRRVVIALQESWVDTDPVPRALPSGGAAELRGRLLFPYRDAHVVVTPAAGKVQTLPLVREADGGFRTWIRCERDGRYQVEIGGEDKLGAEVLANFPVYCGSAPPTEVVLRGDVGVVRSGNEAEERVFALLNADRVEHGLAALQWDGRVAAVARAHSQDMFDHDFVGHVSPTTGSAGDRLRRAKIGTATVLENVARAYSPEEAQRGLMGSPGHRANILSPEATHVGIGIVLGREVAGRPELLVTQLFIRVPPKVDPARAVAEARAVIAERRKARPGLAPLVDDADLGRLASAFARELAAGTARDAAAARLDAGLDKLGARFSVVKTNLMVVGAISQIGGAKNVEDASVSHVGIGVAQGDDAEIGKGALFVVVLLAESR